MATLPSEPHQRLTHRSASHASKLEPAALQAQCTPPPASTALTRRHVLQAGAATAATVALTRPSLADEPVAPKWRDPLSLLIDKATFGFSEATFQEARALGYDAWLDQQLNPSSIDDSANDARLAVYDALDETAATLEDDSWPKPPWEIAHELRAARYVRAVHSRRQLLERMVEFWTDHFSISQDADEQGILKTVEDRTVIRAHALGNFRDLLHASAKSAAMLAYLDNSSNVAGAPNENYSREVMELHTLGVDGPYTEEDVRELARCFTGWTYWRTWESQGEYGTFRFRDDRHDFDAKTVLGVDIPAGGGVSDAETLLDFLAYHPKTADYITRKLGRWLLGYDPPEEVLEQARVTFVQTGLEIAPTVRVFLERGVIVAQPLDELRKFKRPLHWFASVLRALGGELNDAEDTVWEVWSLGHNPFQWPSPDGYPDRVEAWGQGVLQRWRLAARVSHSWTWSFQFGADHYNQLLASTPKDQWATRIDQILKGGTMDRRDVRALQSFIDGFASPSDILRQEAFQLALASPSFQYY